MGLPAPQVLPLEWVGTELVIGYVFADFGFIMGLPAPQVPSLERVGTDPVKGYFLMLACLLVVFCLIFKGLTWFIVVPNFP